MSATRSSAIDDFANALQALLAARPWECAGQEQASRTPAGQPVSRASFPGKPTSTKAET